jgi:hypothetical protein
MHPLEEPPSQAEAGYWSTMLEKADKASSKKKVGSTQPWHKGNWLLRTFDTDGEV